MILQFLLKFLVYLLAVETLLFLFRWAPFPKHDRFLRQVLIIFMTPAIILNTAMRSVFGRKKQQ